MENNWSEAGNAAADMDISADTADSYVRIGEMAKSFGVTLRALRFYEDRGLIRPIRHGASRFYDAAARARFETILRGKQLGFTLTQIFAMLPKDEKSESREKLDLKEGQVLTQIAQLERKREELDTAITALRETHDRMTGGTPAATAA